VTETAPPAQVDGTAPPQRPVLFVNPGSGGGAAARARIAERARERGIEVVLLRPDRDLTAAIGRALAAGADALGVAGGDGSLSTVAAAAWARRLPLICVPSGTRNHFARDLGLDPSDPAGALDAFADGIEARIDVATVNGRLFLNVVSLGIYGEAVRQSAYRDAKLRTLLETARAALGPGGEIPELDLVDDRGVKHDRPAVVLVSNNPYAPARPFARGGRPTLTSGLLGIIVIDEPAEKRRPPGRAWRATSLEVAAAATLHAGLDGEAVELESPLRFASRPGALRVRLPGSTARAG
jgi:diacylglycerol kinase family enzyme